MKSLEEEDKKQKLQEKEEVEDFVFLFGKTDFSPGQLEKHRLKGQTSATGKRFSVLLEDTSSEACVLWPSTAVYSEG